jgi:acetyltransferase-like isoleucine patch superfamily enzyme
LLTKVNNMAILNIVFVNNRGKRMPEIATDIFERLKNGETIPSDDPEIHKLLEASYATKPLIIQMNNSSEPAEIRSLLSQIIGTKIDESIAVFTPLYINYGKNIKIGKNVFINFDCTFLDLGGITIEDNVLIAPKVSLLSEGHPISPESRQSLSPGHIHIKRNAWIGANATILPGVTIGENAVVAAGAVVSKNVPDNVIVAGIPAKIIKTIEFQDKQKNKMPQEEASALSLLKTDGPIVDVAVEKHKPLNQDDAASARQLKREADDKYREAKTKFKFKCYQEAHTLFGQAKDRYKEARASLSGSAQLEKIDTRLVKIKTKQEGCLKPSPGLI